MSYSNQENIKNEYFAHEKEYDKKLADSSCIVNGSKYGEGEFTPGAGPCEECICHPPNVVCSMMKCPINTGCITIQLPNKCCPKYKCGTYFMILLRHLILKLIFYNISITNIFVLLNRL